MKHRPSRSLRVVVCLFAPLWFLPSFGLMGSRSVALVQDDEERQFELARNRRLVAENCLICHSLEMTANQRLTPKQWAAEVDKMIGWGAPVPAEDKARLAAFLASEYPARQPRPAPPRVEASELLRGAEAAAPPPAGDRAAGARLFAIHCASCHGADARGGRPGNNLVEKPILVRPAEFSTVVREGRQKMPGFRAVLSAEQQRDILAWLLGKDEG
jgi:ubiquinol-cytochrome c reductase cytochrome c subunit